MNRTIVDSQKNIPTFSDEIKRILELIDVTINDINQLITINEQVIENLNQIPKEKKGWKIKAIENAILELKNHKLRKIKTQEEISQKYYDNNQLSQVDLFKYEFDAFQDNEIYYLTPTFIFEDIKWLFAITVGDVRKISLGIENKTSLVKYLPEIIKHVQNEVIPFFNKYIDYKQRAKLVQEALLCADKKYYNASNILLMSVIEGIVRVLAQIVMDKQNLNLKQLEFSSLENLILLKKGNKIFNWNEEQLEYPFRGYTNFSKKFEFLIKSYKDERNIIIHGNIDNFGEKWRFYVQLSALYETFVQVKYYYKLYNILDVDL